MAKSSMTKVLSMDYVEGIDELLGDIFPLDDTGVKTGTIKAPTGFLATLLEDYLENNHWSKADLAERLDCPVHVVDAILTGRVPPSRFDSDLIERIATVIGYDASTIGLMVGQEITPDREQVMRQREQESQDYLQTISNVLFETLDAKYDHYSEGRQELYDEVIRELEKLIARQRRDLKFIESLKARLQNPDFPVILPVQGSLRKPTILYLKEHLRRIVKQLQGSESKDIREA
jgi:plasmid maintenance system antidote protein VapI